jgi:hypothetical protein
MSNPPGKVGQQPEKSSRKSDQAGSSSGGLQTKTAALCCTRSTPNCQRCFDSCPYKNQNLRHAKST